MLMYPTMEKKNPYQASFFKMPFGLSYIKQINIFYIFKN